MGSRMKGKIEKEVGGAHGESRTKKALEVWECDPNRWFINCWQSTTTTFQNLPSPSFFSHCFFLLLFLILSNVIVPYPINTCANVYDDSGPCHALPSPPAFCFLSTFQTYTHFLFSF